MNKWLILIAVLAAYLFLGFAVFGKARPQNRSPRHPAPRQSPESQRGVNAALDASLMVGSDMRGQGKHPTWLEIDRDNFKGRVTALPKREDIQLPVNEQLIVELYSK